MHAFCGPWIQARKILQSYFKEPAAFRVSVRERKIRLFLPRRKNLFNPYMNLSLTPFIRVNSNASELCLFCGNYFNNILGTIFFMEWWWTSKDFPFLDILCHMENRLVEMWICLTWPCAKVFQEWLISPVSANHYSSSNGIHLQISWDL